MFPHETAQASIDLKAKVLFLIHWSKFDVSIHDWDEPTIRIIKEADKRAVNIATPRKPKPLLIAQATSYNSD
jgi:hypothetical protein